MNRWEKIGVAAVITIGAIHGAAGLLLDFLMDRGAREARVVAWAWDRSR